MFATFTSDDVTTESEADISNLKQSEQIFAVRYFEVLWDKTLRYRPTSIEARLKDIFIKGSDESV